MPWVAAGFSLEQADHGWNAVDSHIYGSPCREINFSDRAQDYAAMASSFPAPASRRSVSPLERLSRQVNRVALRRGFMPSSFDFEFILDGLEALPLAQQRRRISSG